VGTFGSLGSVESVAYRAQEPMSKTNPRLNGQWPDAGDKTLPTLIWVILVALCIGAQPFLLGFYSDDWVDCATASRVGPPFSAALFRFVSQINPSRIGYFPLRYLFSSLFQDRTYLWQGAMLLGNCLVALTVILLIARLTDGAVTKNKTVAIWAGLAWLVIPWNDALLFWPTMLPNVLTLAALGLLVAWLVHGWAQRRHHAFAAGLIYLWMCLGYEAFYFQWIPIALIGLALWRTGRARLREVVLSATGLFVAQLCAVLWYMIAPRLGAGGPAGLEHPIVSNWPLIFFGDLLTIIPSMVRSFGALAPPFAIVAVLLTVIWAVMAYQNAVMRASLAPAAACLAGGLLSILAFALGGRGIQATGGATRTLQVFNFWLVAAVGVLITALVERTSGARRTAALVVLGCLGVALAVGHLQRLADWTAAWKLQNEILAGAPLDALQKTPAHSTILLIDRPSVNGARIFDSVWDLNAAMPWKYSSLAGRVFFAYNPENGVLRWDTGLHGDTGKLRYETGEPYETPSEHLYVWRPAERSFAEARRPFRVVPGVGVENF